MNDKLLNVIRSTYSKLKVPTVHDKVYKDECVVSFDSPYTEEYGIYCNLITWYSYGHDYLYNDINRNDGKIYLQQIWTQILRKEEETVNEGNEETITRLAIGTPDGFQVNASKYDTIKVHNLIIVDELKQLHTITLPNSEIPEFLSNVINAIIAHDGMKAKMDLNIWDADQDIYVSKYADNLIQLDNNKKISQDPSSWKCELSGDTNNLWLNLSTGYIGGGRKNWDGTGGSGAAYQHYIDTGKLYPLCVKLGTITANGADAWSYAADEDSSVLDPHLSKHLSHFGIDIMQLEKTDKTISEMEVALNQKYDWSRMIDGVEMTILYGAGNVGLTNIGSTCYMNSVVQVLAHLPEVQQRYYQQSQRDTIIHTTPSNPTTDFPTQFSKLLHGILSDRYALSPPTATAAATAIIQEGEGDTDKSILEKYVVAPRMFKALVGKGHKEFSTSRQQDAAEFIQYLLDTIDREEKKHAQRLSSSSSSSSSSSTAMTADLFAYHIENRFEDKASGKVRYSKISDQTLFNMMSLRIPMDKAINRQQVEMIQEKKKQRVENNASSAGTSGGSVEEDDNVKLIVPFEDCLRDYFAAEDVTMSNGSGNVVVEKTLRLKTFSKYLIVQLNRYYVGDNWVQVKIDASVAMPLSLDLTSYRGNGMQDNEIPLAEDDNNTSSGSGSGSGSSVTADALLVESLMNFGFSENASIRAAIATSNADVDVAVNWVLEHTEDVNLNDPIVNASGSSSSSSSGNADSGRSSTAPAEMVEMITSMGYSNEQAVASLLANDNNIEHAMNWIFSHMDDIDEAIAAVYASLGTPNEPIATATTGNACSSMSDGEGHYTLVAIISHIGKSTSSGHYVCHIRSDTNDDWTLFNDDKVAATDIKNIPIDNGYCYLYKRDN